MNPETTEIVNTALRKAIEVASATGQFVVEQAPDVIQQLMVWKTASYAVDLMVGVGLAVGPPLLWKWANKKYPGWHSEQGNYDNFPTISAMIAGLATVVSVIFGIPAAYISAMNLLKITLAPKVWLLEYAASLIQ